jgi:hypothetical protein
LTRFWHDVEQNRRVLSESALTAVYTWLATILRPGGLVLNGDHMSAHDFEPTLRQLGRVRWLAWLPSAPHAGSTPSIMARPLGG